MEYAAANDPEFPRHKAIVKFKGLNEVRLVRAVFREEIFNLARRGKISSISDYDAGVAGWKDDDAIGVGLRLISHTHITTPLERFHRNTSAAISKIVEVSGIPAFDNEYIYRRYDLGQKALELAGAIQEAAVQAGGAAGDTSPIHLVPREAG